MHGRIHRLLFLLLIVAARPAVAQSPIQYVYDDLGRLTGVIDSNGDAAIYHYDAVGNLLSIDRYTSSQVSIIGFTPTSGAETTTVTIHGTGFSTTPSSNTVTFNGTNATVTAATTTELTTTVPSGATTGPIGVSSPNGMATSSESFVVASPGAPTVTSISPEIWDGSSSLTITGTNFDTDAPHDRVALNAALATPATASATSLAVSVPAAATSGHVSVTTPAGTATAADDFFVAPSGYSAANIQSTGRMTLDDSATISLPVANRFGLLVFDGPTGHRVSASFTNVTTAIAAAAIYAPWQTTVASMTIFSGIDGFVEPFVLNSGASYTALIGVDGSHTGNATIHLYDVPADVSGSIPADGTATAVTIGTPGQNANLTFSGTTGQRVSLEITNVTIPARTVSILNPDGSTLGTIPGIGPFLDTQVLASSGDYAVRVDPAKASTGDITLKLYDVPDDVTDTITPGGASVSVTIGTPGQNAELTFSGTADDRVSLQLSNVTISSRTVYILKPDGSTLGTLSGFGTFLDTLTLPTTGTYTILIDPTNAATGSATVTLYGVPADVTGTITPGGSPESVTVTTPGQNAALTFSGSAGQRVSVGLSNVTISGRTVSILNPDGSTLGILTGFGTFMDTKTLPTTGTYTLFVDPTNGATGGMTLTLYDVPADASTSITIGGGSSQLTTTVPGQNALATFAGTASQHVTVHVTSNGMGLVTVKLLKPDGSQLTSKSSSATNFDLTTQTLPSTGTYTVFVDPSGTNLGSINVAATSP